MKFSKVFTTSLTILLFSGFFVSGTLAVTMDCVDRAGLPCTANSGDVLAGGVAVPNSGNDYQNIVEAAIEIATGTAVNLILLGKSDQTGDYGTYNNGGAGSLPDGTLLGTYVIPDFAEFISVKAANSFNVFDVSGTMGSYDTSNILTRGQMRPGVSHISFWGAQSNPVSTPEPGTILLFGSGLAGLGIWRWKTSKTT